MEAKFEIGQVIHHLTYDYRGVVVDVDPIFYGTNDLYDQLAQNQPPKDKPWYHILVDNTTLMTYASEKQIEPDISGIPIEHPWVGHFFDGFNNGKYHKRQKDN
ncbi:MAG TPA: heat shock protein HspQ [Gammaproteobacteria bacterium]|nr:heat shock protein HspQ [Gammaproteobacteria bacterium]